MSQGKIDFSFGSLSFSGEGDEKWLADQLDKVITAVPKLAQVELPAVAKESKSGAGSNVNDVNELASEFTTSLPNHIKAQGDGSNQNSRFLATADWLRRRGNKNLKTSDVTKALTNNHQSRLGNASETLSQNVKQGFCEKTKDGFFITQEGLSKLGYN